MKNKKENWEKEFEKISPAKLEFSVGVDEDKIVCDLKPVILPIKSFIRQEKAKERQEIIERIEKMEGLTLSGKQVDEIIKTLKR